MASIRCLSLLLAMMYLVSHLVFASDEKVKPRPTYHIRKYNGLILYNFSVNTGSSDKVMSRQGGHNEREKAEEDEAEDGHGDRGKRRYEEPSPLMVFQGTLLVLAVIGFFLLGICMGCFLIPFLFCLAYMRNRHEILFNGNMRNVKELSSLLVLYIACILLMVGVTTNSWATAGAGASGKEGDTNDHKVPKTFVAGGIVVGCYMAVAMTLYLFLKDSDSSYKIIPKVCGIAGVVAAVAILVGSVIFAIDEFGDRLSPGYSFFVTLVGALILIAGSVMSMKA